MGRQCEKGKTRGSTCISRMKVCLLDLRNSVSSGVGKLKNMLGGGGSGEERPKESAGELTPKVTSKERKIKEDNSRNVEDTFKGERGRKFFKGIYEDLSESLKNEFPQDQIKDLASSHYRQSREFMRKLADGLPPGVKMTLTDSDKVKLSGKTKSGDKVVVTYSPKTGFHFSVNDSYKVGTVSTREGQLQVAMMVRSLFRSTISALPEGASLFTMAFAADGKGKEREDIYGKLGFSKPKGDEDLMFGRVGSNRRSLTPTDRNTWADQARTRNAVLFSETPGSYEDADDKLGSIEDWYQIVFGNPIKQGIFSK